MFAQLYVNGKSQDIKLPFALTNEKPILKGFIFSVIAGTALGVYLTAVWLMQALPPASLAGAIAAGGAVGGNAGMLLFGLCDVIFNGRLEENAELVEDAEPFQTAELVEAEETVEEIKEEAGKEEDAFFLPKAS